MRSDFIYKEITRSRELRRNSLTLSLVSGLVFFVSAIVTVVNYWRGKRRKMVFTLPLSLVAGIVSRIMFQQYEATEDRLTRLEHYKSWLT